MVAFQGEDVKNFHSQKNNLVAVGLIPIRNTLGTDGHKGRTNEKEEQQSKTSRPQSHSNATGMGREPKIHVSRSHPKITKGAS